MPAIHKNASPKSTGIRKVTDEDLARYVKVITDKCVAYCERNGFISDMSTTVDDTQKPTVRYIRVLTTGPYMARSIHTFIDAETGNILKPGTFTAPTVNPVRGNIYAEGWEACVNQYGAEYLR